MGRPDHAPPCVLAAVAHLNGQHPDAMRKRVVMLFVCGFILATAMAWLSFSSFQRAKLQLSIQFLGYTNASHGMHIGAVQVSNASPFVLFVAAAR